MTYVDRTLSCVDCGVEFIHSAADQEYYVQKGFTSEPKRCTSCRASRRSARDGGDDPRSIGGPRGYERGDDRPSREYFAVLCSSCGNQAQVPFKPRMDRPFAPTEPPSLAGVGRATTSHRTRRGRAEPMGGKGTDGPGTSGGVPAPRSGSTLLP